MALITDEQFEAANARGTARLKKSPVAISAKFDKRTHRVVVHFSSGLDVAFKPHDAQGLENAREEQLAKIEVSPSGLGLYFPELDADLYLPALLEGLLGSKRWMAAAAGRAGGSVSTAAKATAARLNGQLGGRPRRKQAVAA